jgi:hypothetical protein
MQRILTTKNLKTQYRILNHWRKGLSNALWQETRSLREGHVRVRDAKYHDKIILAINKLNEIETVLEEVYGPEIGASVVSDIRNGRKE